MKIIKLIIMLMLFSVLYAYADEATGYVRINISNNPPVIENITLIPEEPFPDSTIKCDAAIIDEFPEIVMFYFEWYKNNERLDETSSQLSGFEPGDVITCKITPNDYAQNGTASYASVTIQKPRISSVILKNTISFLGSSTDIEEINSYQEKGFASITGFVVSSSLENKGTLSLIGILLILIIVNINLIMRKTLTKEIKTKDI